MPGRAELGPVKAHICHRSTDSGHMGKRTEIHSNIDAASLFPNRVFGCGMGELGWIQLSFWGRSQPIHYLVAALILGRSQPITCLVEGIGSTSWMSTFTPLVGPTCRSPLSPSPFFFFLPAPLPTPPPRAPAARPPRPRRRRGRRAPRPPDLLPPRPRATRRISPPPPPPTRARAPPPPLPRPAGPPCHRA